MKVFALCAVVFSVLVPSVLHAADPPAEQVQAAAYFEALTAGDVETADSLSAVPLFSRPPAHPPDEG